jgi:CheY-like chemotaxis protein
MTGYRDRVPVTEVFPVSVRTRALIRDGKSTAMVAKAWTADGARRLVDCARSLVTAGVTTLAEVDRVLGAKSGEAKAKVNAPPPIVLTDRDAVARSRLLKALHKAGLDAIETRDPADTVERLASGDLQCSILILGLDGRATRWRALLDRLRSTPASALLPVVAMVPRSSTTDITLALDDVDDYVTKPFEPRVLLGRVRSLLHLIDLDEAIKPAPAQEPG